MKDGKPKNKKNWIIALTSEYFGTIFLTWAIGLLGVTFGANSKAFEEIISGARGSGSHLVVGFWVALDILFCISIFARWSCDLNPIVSSYRMLAKENHYSFGLSKILIQFLGGITAGGLIVFTQWISYKVNPVAGNEITSLHNTWAAFRANTGAGDATQPGTFLRHLVAFIGEFTGCVILLLSVFNERSKSLFVKELGIVLVVGFGVAALLELGTVGWNPARSLGTNLVFDIVKGGTSGMQIYWAYLLGPLAAVPAVYYGKKLAEDKISSIWDKWQSFKKIK
ncbi:MAG: aquaporin [Mycoplasma sp.]|nr:aquaporin [Mycoplasma sp.]